MRTLLLVPIIHTPTEMGFAEEAVREVKAQMFGPQWASRYQEEISRLWDDLEREVSQLTVDRVYNDSLPLGGSEGVRFVERIAATGSRNYQVLLGLVARGAQLEATEDARLLEEEVRYVGHLVRAGSLPEREAFAARYRGRLADLIFERDRYIARRINESLREGERGLIFLGASHHIETHLDRDIQVVHLVRGKRGQGDPPGGMRDEPRKDEQDAGDQSDR